MSSEPARSIRGGWGASRKRLLLIVVGLTVFASALVFFGYPAYRDWRDPWPALESTADEVRRDDGFELVFAERHGGGCVTILSCDDPRLERVYRSDASPEAACDSVLAKLRAIAHSGDGFGDLEILSDEELQPDEACYADGTIDGDFLTVLVYESTQGLPGHGIPPGEVILAMNVFQ